MCVFVLEVNVVAFAIAVEVNKTLVVTVAVTVLGVSCKDEQKGFPSGESVMYAINSTFGVQYDFGGFAAKVPCRMNESEPRIGRNERKCMMQLMGGVKPDSTDT